MPWSSPLFPRLRPPILQFLASGTDRQSSPPSEIISTQNVFIEGSYCLSLGLMHLQWLLYEVPDGTPKTLQKVTEVLSLCFPSDSSKVNWYPPKESVPSEILFGLFPQQKFPGSFFVVVKVLSCLTLKL